MGPLLFLLYINDLADGLRNLYMFADDTTLLYDSEARQKSNVKDERIETVNKINKDLRNIKGWVHKWKMEVSAEKSQALLLIRNTTSKLESQPPEITYNGLAVPYLEGVQLLGVHINTTLSWKPQIEKMILTANRARSFLWKLKGIADGRDLLNYYKVAVRPLLEYCSPLFAGAPDNVLRKLQQFEDKCYKIIQYYPSRKADCAAMEDGIDTRRQVGTLTYLSKLAARLAPMDVNILVPQYIQGQTSRRSKRIKQLEGAKLVYDNRRPKYAKRCGLNYAITLHNELLAETRNMLKHEIENGDLKRCKKIVVDAIRQKMDIRKD